MLSEAASLRKSESISYCQGWNNFSHAPQADILIMHHGQVLTASLLAHPCGVCESVSFRAVAGSSLLGSQNGKASWTILHFKLELIVFIYNLGRTGITEVAICTELHRVWMVTPGGRQNKAALFECPRSYGGSSNVAVFDTARASRRAGHLHSDDSGFLSDCLHSECSSRGDPGVAVQFLWPALQSPSPGTPEWPVPARDTIADTFKSRVALRAFKSHSPCHPGRDFLLGM